MLLLSFAQKIANGIGKKVGARHAVPLPIYLPLLPLDGGGLRRG